MMSEVVPRPHDPAWAYKFRTTPLGDLHAAKK
jgi:hypothetical protein